MAGHYRGFAAESAAMQQENVAFVIDLSGVVRSLPRQTDAGLFQAWTKGYTLHQRVRHLDDQLGRLSSSGDLFRAEERGELNVLTILQVEQATISVGVNANAAGPGMPTMKAAMEAEINRAVQAQLNPLV